MQTGNIFDAKASHPKIQFHRSGAILRDNTIPNEFTGYVGNIYINTDTRQMFMKRLPTGEAMNTWGNWIFGDLPSEVLYQAKWYGVGRPSNSLGVDGDYYLMWSCDNPGLSPHIFGPKLSGEWPENGEGIEVCESAAFTTAIQIGTQDEGPVQPVDYAVFMKLMGLLDETDWAYIDPLICYTPLGIETNGIELNMTLNPAWNIEADNGVGSMVLQTLADAGVPIDLNNLSSLSGAIAVIANTPQLFLGINSQGTP